MALISASYRLKIDEPDPPSGCRRGFDKGTCFELAAAVTVTNFKAYDPGLIKSFSEQDRANVMEELKTIISSFHARKTTVR
jgi:hypothetical protein